MKNIASDIWKWWFRSINGYVNEREKSTTLSNSKGKKIKTVANIANKTSKMKHKRIWKLFVSLTSIRNGSFRNITL